MEQNIIEKIIQIKDVLPKKQRLLCNYLVLHYVDAGMMTVAELAEQAQVGTTTVLRLMKNLGYDNYSDFRHALLNISLMRTTSSYRGMKQSLQKAAREGEANIFNSLWDDFSHTIGNTITPKNTDNLRFAGKIMLDASCIYVLGLRSSGPVASYFESAVGRFWPNTRLLTERNDYLFDRALRIGSNDVTVIFSVWPCTRLTIDIADLIHENGARIILVTNTQLNPIARYADVVLDTNSVNCNCGSLPVVFVAEALIAEFGRLTAPESTEALEKLERQLESHNIFIKERA